MGTAVVAVRNKDSGAETFRALCDNGSQVNLITQSVINRLGLDRLDNRVQFVGINGAPLGHSLGSAQISIILPRNKGAISAEFMIVKSITNYQPEQWEGDETITNGLRLADPKYNQPGVIELLLGVGIWIRVIKPGVKRSSDTTVAAQNSKLGWIIFKDKRVFQRKSHVGAVRVQESVESISRQLEKFWQLEEVGAETVLSQEEQQCEEFFRETHSRDNEGRYVVRLPFNDKIHDLGGSKRGAIAQFLRMERKMAKDSQFAEKYREFMREYEDLGHMSKITEAPREENGYYTPHHGVVSSSKFRIVFNASASTTSGISLNEAQMVGAKLQRDIFDILVDFRKGRYGYTGDIEKMYRQILVDVRDRQYQKIVWRASDSEPICMYELNTVTYGHASAPHCAVRAMNQCAADNEEKWPHGARIIRHNFYVDDLILSCNTREELLKFKQEVIGLLAMGKMKLVKERSNLQESREAEGKHLEFQENKPVLGLLWDTNEDNFCFHTNEANDSEETWTKRGILSKMGRIFDPLGLVTPMTLVGKIILQELWRTKLGWDEPVTGSLLQEWAGFLRDLPTVNGIKVPRWIGQEPQRQIQFHGFCDASTRGYGAAVYIRVRDDAGNVRIHLLAAKSRVAPLKEVTIPRLELCSAKLLIDLMARLIECFDRNQIEEIHCWSDSQISLYWIYGSQQRQNRLKVFVATRVAKISKWTEEWGAKWHWVSGKENPADLASRGVLPSVLFKSGIWWRGPDWLKTEDWPIDDSKFQISDRERDLAQVEMKNVQHVGILESEAVTFAINHANILRVQAQEPLMLGPWYKHTRGDQRAFEFLESFSDYKKLKWVSAMLLRAKHNFLHPKHRRVERLTIQEGDEAVRWLIQQDQAATVREEIQNLKGKRGSHLNFRFDPEEKILRVVGRLENADLTMDEKNPIYLSPEGNLAKLLVRHAHDRTLHGGTQEMLQFLRAKYWIPGARKLVKQIPLRCPACFRHRIKLMGQQMAVLPAERVNQAFPFQHCGIDYAGPVILRSKYGRNPTLYKAWIGVFVCLVTRAVTLELVSDATSVAFIAALRRVISRRGAISRIVSDNGTNFVGAAKVLRGFLSENHIRIYERHFEFQWVFNPPSAPHHGGIFEAAVKSMKHHLRRVIGTQSLTFEEYDTLLKQVEGCMNSRPLGAVHDDSTLESHITPAHFLIGRKLVALPEEESLLDRREFGLKRWQRVQQMYQRFWEEWKNTYLLGLIRRTKWDGTDRNAKVGDIVVVKNENERPTSWWLARVRETYPGRDGLIRTVKLSYLGKDYVRPITKLGLLIPIEEQQEEGNNKQI